MEAVRPSVRPEPRGEAFGPALAFMRAVWELEHRLVCASRWMRSRLGVTGPQSQVIRLVESRPGITAGELAVLLHLHPSTLTGVLERLVRARLVERWRDSGDGRRALFRLTRRGKAVAARRSGTAEAAVDRALSRLDPRDVRAAQRVLTAVARELPAG